MKRARTPSTLTALAVAALLTAGCGGAPEGGGSTEEGGAMAAPAEQAAASAAAGTERGAPAAGVAEGEAGRAGGGEHAEGGGEHGEGEREHAEGGGEHAEGEESGAYVTAYEAWDETRGGARLAMVFDPGYGNFQGRVYNTTEARLCRVRVEVHLDSGVELGPSESVEVAGGASIAVELPLGDATFERWNAHVEASPCGGPQPHS